MEILFVSIGSAYTSPSYGGAESSMRLMAEKLIKNGHTVHYITRKNTVFTHHQNVSGVLLHVLPIFRGERTFSWIQHINNLILQHAVKKLVLKTTIQIVYCYDELSVLETLIQTKEKHSLTIQIIMRMAGMSWVLPATKSLTMRHRYHHAFNHVDAINYLHESLKTLSDDHLDTLEMTLENPSYFIQDIGTDLTFKRTIQYEKLPEKPFKIIMVARFSRNQKRQDLLVQAMAYIDPNLDIEVTLVGNGPTKETIQNMIASLNLETTVKIVPFMPREKLWALMAESHLMCHACDYEGVSKVMIEGMTIGLPVLISDVQPINAYVHEGFNGFLVANDPISWANKIKTVMSDANLRNQVSTAALADVNKHHRAEQNIKAYERFFASMIKR